MLAVAAYLKETGDWSILDEPVVYENQPGSKAPLMDHLQRSVQYTLDRLGPHGLPLIGRADWNDCLNLNCFSETPGEPFQTTRKPWQGQVAKSVFIAGQFVLAARGVRRDCQPPRRCHAGAGLSRHATRMEAAILQHGWDGEWFLRAYDAFGDKVGSSECQEGQIFIEPQGMCVMAGIGLPDGKAAQALQSVADRLATEHGVVLNQPAYTRYHVELGEISSYPPGYKENASVFCHTNPWIMIAEAMMGRGEQALDYYHRICPSAARPSSIPIAASRTSTPRPSPGMTRPPSARPRTRG